MNDIDRLSALLQAQAQRCCLFDQRISALESMMPPPMPYEGDTMTHEDPKCSPEQPSPHDPTFVERVRYAINTTSQENVSDTPDFILADFVTEMLDALNSAVNRRKQWWGAHEDRQRGERQEQGNRVGGTVSDDVARCPRCGWPLSLDASDGCAIGNCSYRPVPGTEEYDRIHAWDLAHPRKPAEKCTMCRTHPGDGRCMCEGGCLTCHPASPAPPAPLVESQIESIATEIGEAIYRLSHRGDDYKWPGCIAMREAIEPILKSRLARAKEAAK